MSFIYFFVPFVWSVVANLKACLKRVIKAVDGRFDTLIKKFGNFSML